MIIFYRLVIFVLIYYRSFSYTHLRQLCAEDKYSPEGVLLWVSFGESSRRRSEGRRTTYSIYMTHGTGGGRTEGAKANRVAQLASVVDADIYLHAHLHLPLVMRESFCRVSQFHTSQFLDLSREGSPMQGNYSLLGSPDLNWWEVSEGILLRCV